MMRAKFMEIVKYVMYASDVQIFKNKLRNSSRMLFWSS